MGLIKMLQRALMPPQPNGGIKKQLARADKERTVRVKGYVRTLTTREKNYRKQVEADVRRLAAHISGTSAKKTRKKTSTARKPSSRRSGTRSGKRASR